MYLTNPTPEPENGDQCDRLVTPAMAKAGADELREHSFGESLQDIATAVFYAMQAAPQTMRLLRKLLVEVECSMNELVQIADGQAANC